MKKILASKWIKLAAGALLAVVFAVSAVGMAPAFAQSPSPTPAAPQTGAAAAGRIAALEKAFANENTWLATQAGNLQKIGDLITKAQDLIDKAKEKGWNVGPLQAALNVFKAQIATAQRQHDTAAAILSRHAGFDDDGKVTNAEVARLTVLDARQSLMDAHVTLRQAVIDLRSAIRTFRREHRSANQPATPAPTAPDSGS